MLSWAAGASCEEHAPYQDEKKGASDGVTTLDRVTARTIDPAKFSDYGVQVYSSAGTTGARFSRPTGGGEYSAEESDKDEESDKESKADPCTDAQGDLVKGNPIYIATGNKLEPELDFAAEGEWPLFLKRTYNHHWVEAEDGGLFGKKWLSNFDYRMGQGACYARPGQAKCAMDPGNGPVPLMVKVLHPDGGQQIFNKSPAGPYYVSKGSPLARLFPQADVRSAQRHS